MQLGLNRNNYSCNFVSEQAFGSTSVSVTISGLSPSTMYDAYIAATNSVQRFKDPNTEIKSLSFSTLEDNSDDDFSGYLLLTFLHLLLF